MGNKKEPLMSAFDWFIENTNRIPKKEDRGLIEKCAKYYAQWHLNNAKEFVADEAKLLSYTSYNGVIDFATPSIDKQSIHTAIDNYIKDNLNKEL